MCLLMGLGQGVSYFGNTTQGEMGFAVWGSVRGGGRGLLWQIFLFVECILVLQKQLGCFLGLALNLCHAKICELVFLERKWRILEFVLSLFHRVFFVLPDTRSM